MWFVVTSRFTQSEAECETAGHEPSSFRLTHLQRDRSHGPQEQITFREIWIPISHAKHCSTVVRLNDGSISGRVQTQGSEPTLSIPPGLRFTFGLIAGIAGFTAGAAVALSKVSQSYQRLPLHY